MDRFTFWKAVRVLVAILVWGGAASADTFGLFTYTPSYPYPGATSITITGYPTNAVGSVEIPTSILGNPVTSIGNSAFASCSGLTSVTIPSGVTSIGNSAFAGCIKLMSVTIPESVYRIGPSSFADCWSLASMTLPASLDSIGDSAFFGCWRLASVMIPPEVTSIGASAFESCTGLTSVIILSSNMVSMGNSAFAYCTSLSNVTISSGVTRIGTYMFFYCEKLKSVHFLGDAPALGANVFFGTDPGFMVYYFNDKAGFSLPTWNGYPAVNMGASSPAAPWLLANGFADTTDMQTDPNGNGVSLLLAYALNLDPKQKYNGGGMPRLDFAADQMFMTFRSGSPGVTYTVESSTDMIHWSSSGITIIYSGQYVYNNHVYMRSTASMARTGPSCFMRLVVSY